MTTQEILTSNLFKEILERTNQAVFGFNLKSKEFIYINAAFENLWQKTSEKIKTDPASLLESIYPDDKDYLINAYHQKLENGLDYKSLEFRIVHPNTNLRWACLSTTVIEQEPGVLIIAGFIQDISVSKEHSDNMQKFAAKKNSILEILSHDLSGPLINIQGLSTMVAKRIKDLENNDLNKMIKMISDTCDRSIRMIREFVKQEFLESSHAKLSLKRTNIVEAIKVSMDQYKESEHKILKKFDLTSSNDEIYLDLDDYKFNQVINNLISNSIKFTRDGGHIAVHIEDKDEQVLITVSDDGVGIPENRQNDLFEKFTKARRPGLKGEPSVGLGMSIIKTIVEWHHGKIWFKSEEGKGTIFYIDLPKTQPESHI